MSTFIIESKNAKGKSITFIHAANKWQLSSKDAGSAKAFEYETLQSAESDLSRAFQRLKEQKMLHCSPSIFEIK